MFHGPIATLYNTMIAADKQDDFENIMDDFTHNFNKYFFSKEYVKNLFWNLCFPGFFYCPIDRKTFLQGKYL